MKVHFILYVSDQKHSAAFYSTVLGKDPILDVPGMTEFSIGEQTEKNSKKATIQGGLFLCPGIQNDSIYAQLLGLKLLTFNKIWLMPSSSSSVNSISTDLMLSSICSGRLAPMMAELTPGWRRIQARAS